MNNHGATLNGEINPGGAATTVSFEWGTDTAYGNILPGPQLPAGTETVPVSADLTDLADNTEFHFRVIATNEAGTFFGEDMFFITPDDFDIVAPTGQTLGATNIF